MKKISGSDCHRTGVVRFKSDHPKGRGPLAGIQEILTIILLIACIIFLPRLFGGNRSTVGKKNRRMAISGKLRLAIVLSVVFPLAVAMFFPPWHPETGFIFFPGALILVALCWAGAWIFQGFHKK